MRAGPQVRLTAAALASASFLTGCGGPSAPASSGPPPASPLATAVATAGETWATVPVGSGPNGTFWQLLYRPGATGTWVDDVAATATATNAGIDLAASGTDLLAGVRASRNLTFSPVVETSNAGSDWIDGVLPGALADTPQALAVSATGTKAAILGPPGAAQEVVSAGSDITRWSRSTTAGALGPAGRRCRVSALEAASYYAGATLLLGTACSAPGAVGLFALTPGRPPLAVGPAPPADTTSEVLALSTNDQRASALLLLRRHGLAALVSMSTDSSLRNWTLSAPLAMDPASSLASVTEDSGGFHVLLRRAGRVDLYAVGPAPSSWQALPVPPDGTAAVAVLPGGSLDALVTEGTTIVSWDLPAGAAIWARGQALEVPVLYGSTS